MLVKEIKKNHKILEDNLEEIIKYGIDIIDSKKNSKYNALNKTEKKIIIEGLLLRACAIWEKFLEAEVVLLTEMDKSKLLEEFELPKDTFLTQKVIKSMLFSNFYRNFHDIERAKGFFNTFIVKQWNLFDTIAKEQVEKINMVYKLRNYLAHYSDFAKRKLKVEYEVKYQYSKFMEPGIFLIKSKGKYFENLIHNFILVSAKMKSKIQSI